MSSPDRRPRRTVAVLDDYADAQRAVDHLSDNGFPVERVAIVGHGLRYVEQVAGRMTTGTAALMGAAQGAALGALFGLAFGLIFTIDPSPAVALLVLYGVVAGAVLGAIFGALTHAASRGERDFTSVSGMEAERYEVVVDEDVADRAAELLRSFRTAGAGAAATDRSGTPA
ncbi:MAG: hypothetical protein QOC64_3868 [Solirubrobacteraceae bacterium]|nr:hypothetical protein [Solirubrobacteraceae bacterium]